MADLSMEHGKRALVSLNGERESENAGVVLTDFVTVDLASFIFSAD